MCDFDGTVSTIDMGYEILNRFTHESWKEIDKAYCAGEIGSKIAYSSVAQLFRGTKAQMMEFIHNNESLDDYFPGFYRFCKDMGFDVKIISDGLDFYIKAVLSKHSLEEIEFFSNVLVFDCAERVTIDFPEANIKCNRCGTCKSSILKNLRPKYNRIIYIGDGHSDVCASKHADFIFAKGILFDSCQKNGTICIRFENFGDVHERIKTLI